MTNQPGVGGRLATVVGVVGPFAAIGISFVILRALAGEDTPVVILGLASLFFGQMAFDIGCAASFAASRLLGQGRDTANYSSAAAFGVMILVPWIPLTLVGTADHQGGLLASPLTVAVLGPTFIALQFSVVNRLNRVARPSQLGGVRWGRGRATPAE